MRLIFNRRAGRGTPLLPLLRRYVEADITDSKLFLTDGPGHATILAQAAVRDGCRRVIAVGGDGTVNEVAQALVRTSATLGIVPAGSGNGLARHLQLPLNPQAALELATATDAHTIDLDTGVVNGRPFFNAMGLGLDALISDRFSRLTRRGLRAYLRTALGAYFASQNELCVITTGEQREAIEVLLITIANSDQYGNGARIAPGARMDDGLLDLVAVGPIGPIAGAVLAARLFLGNFDQGSAVSRLRGTRFRIERPAPGLIHTDGEVYPAGALLDVVVQPRSLHVVVP